MINILIVDDNPEKIKSVKALICKIPVLDIHNITIAPDINNAKRNLLMKQFDLMILDISLPERFGDMPGEKAGVDFLTEINIDSDFNIPYHIIGLTAYPELKEKYGEEFSQYLWHLIVFEEEYGNWEFKLSNYLNYLLKSKEELKDPSNSAYLYDIAIVTVLSLELKYVKELPGNWIEEKFSNDDNFYYTGYVTVYGKKLKLVLTSTNNSMGMSAAATVSMKIISRYKPKYITMIGICAGIEGKGDIGDPLIADKVWDYGSGKYVIEKTDAGNKEVFKPYINQLSLNNALNSLFTKSIEEGLYVSDIQKKWPIKCTTILKAKLGPFASGSAVIANEFIVDSIKQQHGQLMGFDMESYAIYYAAHHSQSPRPIPFIIKSISDFGDSNKNDPNKDNYQAYAAYTSANYFWAIIKEFPKYKLL